MRGHFSDTNPSEYPSLTKLEGVQDLKDGSNIGDWIDCKKK